MNNRLVVISTFLFFNHLQYLWAPNDRSLAYAYHVQVATDEHCNEEMEYMQDDDLQSDSGNVHVEVSPIDLSQSGLKPMKMQCSVLFVEHEFHYKRTGCFHNRSYVIKGIKTQSFLISRHLLQKVILLHYAMMLTSTALLLYVSIQCKPTRYLFSLQLCPNRLKNTKGTCITGKSVHSYRIPSWKQFNRFSCFLGLINRMQDI